MNQVLEQARAAKAVAPIIGTLNTAQKNTVLRAAADALEAASATILEANAKDLAVEMPAALQDRLRLNPERIAGIAQGLRQVADLPDPVGTITQGRTLENGLRISQVRVPLGVMGMVYEARPNVTVDAFGLALKSGNVALLRGSKSALHSNTALVAVLQEVLEAHELPAEAVQLLPCDSHETVQQLITARGLVDVVIPRGGAGLIEAVVTGATVPTIETGTGTCHLYIDRSADVAQAIALAVNGKTRRPSVCNTTETVLLDAALPFSAQQSIVSALEDAGVTIHADPENVAHLEIVDLAANSDVDFNKEYLSMDVSLAVVDGVEQAVQHIRTYSSGHTDAIAARDIATADYFVAHVDSAAVSVNASTAFTDGEQYGMGAEIGISTQKLHARGPMGLPELTTTKWVVRGEGHIRP